MARFRAKYPDVRVRAIGTGSDIDRIDRHCRAFIELSPWATLATAEKLALSVLR